MREDIFSFRHVCVVRLHPQSANVEVCVFGTALLMFKVLWNVKRQRSGRLNSLSLVTY